MGCCDRRPAPSTGRIELICGPMFSGKTTELIRRVRRQQHSNRSCLLLSYRGDTRYNAEGTAVTTHDLAEMHALPVMSLAEAQNAAPGHDVIAIDEGQFLPDLVQYAEAWANMGKLVMVAALDATYQRQPFESVVTLVPLAESVCKLTAVCVGCHQAASFTFRKDGGSHALEDVGGSEKYDSRCRDCYAAGMRAQAAAAERPTALTASDTPRRATRRSTRMTSPHKATKRQSLTSVVR